MSERDIQVFGSRFRVPFSGRDLMAELGLGREALLHVRLRPVQPLLRRIHLDPGFGIRVSGFGFQDSGFGVFGGLGVRFGG